ncbi:MAG: hypothetical protein HC915_00705 [Anaerolineae bacterium]|nr:hypothetical protein [Anaerolineae bacterium]
MTNPLDPAIFTNCDQVARPGETIWYRIVLENRSNLPMTNFSVTDTARGTLANSLMEAGCWLVGVPTSIDSPPMSGWGSGTAGRLGRVAKAIPPSVSTAACCPRMQRILSKPALM